MYSGLRKTNSYGLRILSKTNFLIIHGFSCKIKSNIRALKEIWILKSVDEGVRDTNFKVGYFEVDGFHMLSVFIKSEINIV